MMNKNPILLSFVVLVLADHGRASQITFNTLPVTVQHGTYNGFVGASIDGSLLNIISDDYFPSTYVPSGPWDYNVSTLPNLTSARFGSDDLARMKYAEAAVLLAGDGSTLAGIANVTTHKAITDYQYALWALFSNDVPHVDDESLSLLNTAQNDVLHPPSMNAGSITAAFANLRIFTPSAPAASNQEFLGISAGTTVTVGEITATPEPATTFLAGIGLFLLSFLTRKFSGEKTVSGKR
jgi:hypothetical protein